MAKKETKVPIDIPPEDEQPGKKKKKKKKSKIKLPKLSKKDILIVVGAIAAGVALIVLVLYLRSRPPAPPDAYIVHTESVPSITAAVPGLMTADLQYTPPEGDPEAPEPVEDEVLVVPELVELEYIHTAEWKAEQDELKKLEQLRKASLPKQVEITQMFRYGYHNLLLDGSRVMEAYVNTLLLEDNGFEAVDIMGYRVEEELDLSQDEGHILLGRKAEDESGLLRLSVDWSDSHWIVTTSFIEGGKISNKPKPKPSSSSGGSSGSSSNAISLEDAIGKLKGIGVSALGLTGDIGDYLLLPAEGLAQINGEVCVQITAYRASDHSYQGQYLVANGGQRIYRVKDRSGRQVEEITIPTTS